MRRHVPTPNHPADRLTMVQRWERARRVLATPYWRLLPDDGLNLRRRLFVPPQLHVLEDGGEWLVLALGNCRFYWPAEYSPYDSVRSLYHETFAPARMNPHTYEHGDVRIAAGDWVIDAGACEGFFTHLALQRGARVLMVEPVPRLAEALSHTFEKQIRDGRVRLLAAALGGTNECLSLRVPRDAVYCAAVGCGDGDAVQVHTLDSLVGGLVPRVDFLKMDIEGSEVAAIEGARGVLTRMCPRLSIAVYHEPRNAATLRKAIVTANPSYKVRYRGVFFGDISEAPRPWMLYASRKGAFVGSRSG